MFKVITTTFLVIVGISLLGQTISITSSNSSVCFNYDLATLSSDDGGTPVRNIYTGSTINGDFPFQVIWNSATDSWDIDVDNEGTGFINYYRTTYGTYPNPPSLGGGNWAATTSTCTELTQFSGNGTGAPLSIEVLSFKGFYSTSLMQLSWIAASELNNDKFEVEFSLDGNEYRTIGEVEGSGTSFDKKEYEFDHKIERHNGLTYYYRLKQFNFDGQFNYSKVISISTLPSTDQLSVYPNPASNNVRLSMINEDQEKINVIFYNTLGRMVKSELITNEDMEFDVSTLNSGSYIIEIHRGNDRLYSKLLIARK